MHSTFIPFFRHFACTLSLPGTSFFSVFQLIGLLPQMCGVGFLFSCMHLYFSVFVLDLLFNSWQKYSFQVFRTYYVIITNLLSTVFLNEVSCSCLVSGVDFWNSKNFSRFVVLPIFFNFSLFVLRTLSFALSSVFVSVDTLIRQQHGSVVVWLSLERVPSSNVHLFYGFQAVVNETFFVIFFLFPNISSETHQNWLYIDIFLGLL